jgi:hypothetical protein
VNERELEHAEVVLGCLLEPREDSPALLEPPNETFNDVAFAVSVAVKLNRAGVAIFVFLGRNHRRDAFIEKILVDPVGTISLVAGQPHGTQGLFRFLSRNVHSLQQRLESLRFVCLSCREMHVQRVAVAIAEQMDLGRKSAPRTA